MKVGFTIILISIAIGCSTLGSKSDFDQNKFKVPYRSESLTIKGVTATTFIHESFLQSTEYGKVSCNGLIYLKSNKAIVFDTPSSDQAAQN